MEQTLDELLAELIKHAAGRFGPRYRETLPIAPVIFGGAYPQTSIENGVITVRVTESVRTDPMRARYQLAHEAVHCVGGTCKPNTIYFEEGLATYYAITLPGLDKNYLRACKKQLHGIFLAPLAAFEALIPTDKTVSALRAQQPNMDQLEPRLVETILRVAPDVAASVCQRMALDRPEGI